MIDSAYIVFDSIPTGTYKQSKYGWVEQGLDSLPKNLAPEVRQTYAIQKRQLPLFAKPHKNYYPLNAGHIKTTIASPTRTCYQRIRPNVRYR